MIAESIVQRDPSLSLHRQPSVLPKIYEDPTERLILNQNKARADKMLEMEEKYAEDMRQLQET